MRDMFEEIRRQIHEIRNLWAPFDFKLAGLDHQIAAMRAELDARIGGVETRVLASSFKIEEQGTRMDALWERVEWLETFLKVPPRPARAKSLPVREDKSEPEILPPQNPAP
jgi:hypothetical protein